MPQHNSNSRPGGAGRPRTKAASSGRRRQVVRHISVRSELRTPPDVRKIGRAIIRMAMREAEAERQAQLDFERADNEEAPDALDRAVGDSDDQ